VATAGGTDVPSDGAARIWDSVPSAGGTDVPSGAAFASMAAAAGGKIGPS